MPTASHPDKVDGRTDECQALILGIIILVGSNPVVTKLIKDNFIHF